MAILLCNSDLLVSQKTIREGIHLLTANPFKDLISKRTWEQIMHTCIIQLSEVDIIADFVGILIMDHHRAYPL